VLRQPHAAPTQAPAQPEAADGDHAVRGRASADPQPAVLATREPLLDPPRHRHAGDELEAVQLEGIPLRIDPVTA
jgi:hypothetical protein